MPNVLTPSPKQQFFDNNGNPAAGYKLFTYAAGGVSKLATTVSASGANNTNPIILDYRGEANVWIPPNIAFKYVLAPPTDTDPPTHAIWTVDNIVSSQLITLYGGVDTGSANAYVLNFTSNFSALTDGVIIYWLPSNTNTGASSLSVNGTGGIPILNQDGTALYAGEIRQNQFSEVIFKGGNFYLLSDTASSAFSAQRITSSQSMPASTITNCVFNSASINQGTAYATGTGIFTAPAFGIYQFNVLIVLAPAGTNCVLNSIYLSKNNANVGAGSRFDIGIGLFGQQYSNTGNNAAFSGSTLIQMNPGDTMQVKWDAGTSAVATNNMSTGSCFSGGRVA